MCRPCGEIFEGKHRCVDCDHRTHPWHGVPVKNKEKNKLGTETLDESEADSDNEGYAKKVKCHVCSGKSPEIINKIGDFN